MATLVVNKLRGGLKLQLLKLLVLVIEEKQCWKILLFSEAKLLVKIWGLLENVTLDMLGTSKRVVVDKENTTIVQGAGKKKDIEGRCIK